MSRCDPHDLACVNRRTYYQTDFKRPEQYSRPSIRQAHEVSGSKDPHLNIRNADLSHIDYRTPVPQGVVRPLKQMSKLTPSQIQKGRMVAASYEIDHKINQEMKYTGKEIATSNVLRRESDSVLRQTELEGWKVIKESSDKQYLVLEKGSNVNIVFRGRAGDNPVDNTHV